MRHSPLSPFHVINETMPQEAVDVLNQVQMECYKMIDAGRGETFYELEVLVRLKYDLSDQVSYAVIHRLTQEGWDNVYILNNVLHLSFPKKPLPS